MAKENFLLLSLDDSKAKKVANAVNNESARKILNYLATQDATESELAKKLNIPISTVHYNLEQLKQSGLVDWEKFHYSQKGKEVRHYHLVNKYIIIAPKEDKTFMDKLKTLFPAFLTTAIGAGLVYKFTSPEPMESAMMLAESTAEDSARMVAMEAPQAVSTLSTLQAIEPVLWFLLGAGIVMITTFFFLLITEKKKTKSSS